MSSTGRVRWLNVLAIAVPAAVLGLLLTSFGRDLADFRQQLPADARWTPAAAVVLALGIALSLAAISGIGVLLWALVAPSSKIDRIAFDDVAGWRVSVPMRFAFKLLAVTFALMSVTSLVGVSIALRRDLRPDLEAELRALLAWFVPLTILGIILILRAVRIRLEIRAGVFTSVGFIRRLRFDIRRVYAVETRTSGLIRRLVVVTTTGAVHGIAIPWSRASRDVEALAADVDRHLAGARSSFDPT